MVVAGLEGVEQRRVDLDAERLAGHLVDLDGELEAAPLDVEGQVGLVGEDPPPDQVAGRLAVDGRDLVAHSQPGVGGRRPGDSDGDDRGWDTATG